MLSRYLSRLSRGLAWHGEAGPGEGVVVVSGVGLWPPRWQRLLLRSRRAAQAGGQPGEELVLTCVRLAWESGGQGWREPGLGLPWCRDRPARGDRGAGSAPAPALAPALTAFLPLSPSSCRRLGRNGGAGPAAVPLRHRDQPGAG